MEAVKRLKGMLSADAPASFAPEVRGTVDHVDASGRAWCSIPGNPDLVECAAPVKVIGGDAVTIAMVAGVLTATENHTHPVTDDALAKLAAADAGTALENARSALERAAAASESAEAADEAARQAAESVESARRSAASAAQSAESTAQAARDAEAAAEQAARDAEASGDNAEAAAQAAQDADEAASRTVVLVEYEYALNYNIQTPPSSGWSSDYPDWSTDAVIWRRATLTRADGTSETRAPERVSGNKGDDAVQVSLTSSNGTVFKRSLGVDTTVRAAVLAGGERIETASALAERFGAGAYLEWAWKDVRTGASHVILATDPRISEGGFALTVSPDDVDVQAVITCTLVC